jgi:hypothetical protein
MKSVGFAKPSFNIIYLFDLDRMKRKRVVNIISIGVVGYFMRYMAFFEGGFSAAQIINRLCLKLVISFSSSFRIVKRKFQFSLHNMASSVSTNNEGLAEDEVELFKLNNSA